MRGAGTVVGIATAWDDAIDIVEQTQPDVLLIDDSMPGAHGSLADRVAAVRRASPATAVIVFSGLGDEHEAIAAGAVGYVRKPATTSQLRAAITGAAGGSWTTR